MKACLLLILLTISAAANQPKCSQSTNELKKLTDLSKEFNKQIEKAKQQLKIELRMP